ncbi:MAG: hypothetical protein IJ489_10770 [Clostridia bacterium]|nr:hypothetical protein [Clostridia bacterium]
MKRLKILYRWLVEKEKIFLLVFSVIYTVFLVLHMAFYTQEDKLPKGIVTAIVPFIVYAGFKLMFKLIRVKVQENYVIGFIAFYGFAVTYGLIMFLCKYIQIFPDGLAMGVNLCMAGFLELISEMKKTKFDETNK